MDQKTIVINFYGGPGSGKSTTAAQVFSFLKWRGVNCELVTEFAKDKTWEESLRSLEHQEYIFGKQKHRLWRVAKHVPLIVTDAPLGHSLVYGRDVAKDSFVQLIKDSIDDFENLDVFLIRQKGYNPKGRSQTLEQAEALDKTILSLLEELETEYVSLLGFEDNVNCWCDGFLRDFLKHKGIVLSH